MTAKPFPMDAPRDPDQELIKRIAAAAAMAAGAIYAGICQHDASERDIAEVLVNAVTVHINHCPPPVQRDAITMMRKIVAEYNCLVADGGAKHEPRH